MSSFSGKSYTLRICWNCRNVGLRMLGSSSRAFGMVDLSATSLLRAAVTSVVAAYCCWLTWPPSDFDVILYAARVASMLRPMYSASFSLALGRTLNCCTTAG